MMKDKYNKYVAIVNPTTLKTEYVLVDKENKKYVPIVNPTTLKTEYVLVDRENKIIATEEQPQVEKDDVKRARLNYECKILVIYVGVTGVRSEDISNFTRKVAKKIIPDTFQGEVIVLPVQLSDTRIECINPQYITDVDLIKEHTDMMKKLQEALQYQLEQLKIEKKNE